MSFLLNPFVFAGAAGDFESIATVTVGSGGASSVTFSSIPGTYQHLQIRYISKRETSLTYLGIKLNGTQAPTTGHRIFGEGSSVFAGQNVACFNADGGTASNVFAVGIVDLLDYTSTTKNKVARGISGSDSNGSGLVMLGSALWVYTTAVTSIQLYEINGGYDFAEHSQFALYGIKA